MKVLSTLQLPMASHPASFRDPAGFVYRGSGGCLLRQVNSGYESDFQHLMDSGLYDDLTSAGLLVAHEEVGLDLRSDERAAFVIRPEMAPFVSYPYEWAFSALKDAALLTLEIQRQALHKGMTLKDASAYNVQFFGGRPRFIDTLSLETYQSERPWAAYGQFCRHFVAPLALMSSTDISLGRLMALHLDGVPLDLASKLLPGRTWLSLSNLLHIHWHAKSIRKHAETKGPAVRPRTVRLSLKRQLMLIEGLRGYIEGLSWKPANTEWGDYYQNHSYTEESQQQKLAIVSDFLDQVQPQSVWDFGANTGMFSRLASERGAYTTAFDVDPACVEINYRRARKEQTRNLLPLWLDLTNPSPAIGWRHAERDSLLGRGPCDAVLALALVHHLAITNNTPFDNIAEFFASCSDRLLIEWVPKSDPQTQRLLRSRPDIFESYTQEQFEMAMVRWFDMVEQRAVGSSGRVLYSLRRRFSAGD
ncbi:methyltransferase domain-containing protein [Lignipirellula cremea]|uniref:SAM-dependent methyltransferase n=1 Tax=Lignipirellula cremea TaxID=2528010 RepID=A0A518DSL8_9BACT|nr:class I SAM-dependent methyltransferase [Lignipirellula cremea]QDU94829.1 hypothetical protein Pla8534_26370 [Lignipirellula cremea]